jgi:hypothetical protein
MRIESNDRSSCAVLCMNGWCEIFKLRLVGDGLRQRRSRRLHLFVCIWTSCGAQAIWIEFSSRDNWALKLKAKHVLSGELLLLKSILPGSLDRIHNSVGLPDHFL